MNQEIYSLKLSLNSRSAEKESLESELHQIKDRLANILQDGSGRQADLAALETSLDRLRSDVAILRKDLGQKDLEIESLKMQLETDNLNLLKFDKMHKQKNEQFNSALTEVQGVR